MAEQDLSFSTSAIADTGSFKLLELPPDLLKLIESSLETLNPLTLTIRGQTGDDAVLCTEDKTYSVRSVTLSNSVLVVTPPGDDDALQGVVIRDQVNEILELAPAVPKLYKLSAMLKGREYDDGEEDADMDADMEASTSKISYADIRAQIQASDAEFHQALKDRHILNLNGELRPVAPEYLNNTLELILNILVSLSVSHTNAPVEDLTSALADDHEMPRAVSTQIMSWFGEVKEGRWKMDAESVVREIGLGILRGHKDRPIDKKDLIKTWKTTVGDKFESFVSLSLLSGNYLVTSSFVGDTNTLTYFPSSSLPVEPAPRFADLFLTRERWRSDDIAPFLADIAVNNKERDKLLLKFARATTDSTGVWFTARAQYNG